MKLRSLTPSLLVLLASCGPATVLEPRYVAVHNTLSAMGFAQTGTITEGSLPEGGEVETEVELVEGECYAFLALASRGLDDVDVRVYDGEEELARDVTHDAQASARVCPPRTDRYRVVLSAVDGGGSYLLSSWSGGTARRVARASSGGEQGGEALELGGTVSGSTAGGETLRTPGCVGGNSPERVHALEITERAQVSIRVESTYDAVLYLTTEYAPSEELACNDDDGDTSRSRVDVTLEPGTYYVVVDGYGDNNAGSYTLRAEQVVMQDLATVCQAARPLIPGQPVTDDTTGVPGYFGSTCAGSSGGSDHVYQLDIAQRSRVRLFQQTNQHDGSLYMRSSCEVPSSEIACDDDFASTAQSLVTTVVGPGTYFVYSDGYGTNSGNAGPYTLTADVAPASGGGANADTCANAGSAPNGPFDIDTFAAGDELMGSCGGQGAPDVVYNFTLSGRSRVRINLNNPQFDGAMYIQSQCGDASTERFCAAITRGQTGGGAMNPRTGQMTPYSVDLDPGTYSLVLDGQRPESFGSAQVSLDIFDIAAQRRLCQRAPMLRSGRSVSGTTAGERNSFEATCAGNAASGDRVYRIRLTRRSDIDLRLQGSHDAALHIRRDCQDSTTELACNDDDGQATNSRITTTLDRGTYYVVVDGFSSGNEGTFTLNYETGSPGSLMRPVQQPPNVVPQPRPWVP
ncbi:MAG: hypothetical protein AAF645_24090 [Myxococcota bacterium]